MKLRTGDVWDAYNPARHHLLLAPCNGYLAGGKRLVMGAGFAKQVRERFRGVDNELAWAIKGAGERSSEKQPIWLYGVANWTWGIGAFQSKLHWKAPSYMFLIKYSVDALAKRLEDDPELVVNMPMPGVGLGGLDPDRVMPVLETLPDRVTVWVQE